MRSKILQLKRIRELRSQQKQREFLSARNNAQRAEKVMQTLGEQYREVQREIQTIRGSFGQPGETLSGVEIEQRFERIARLEGFLRGMVPRVKAADAARKKAREELQKAKDRQKAAERAVDQISQLDKKLAAEEIAEAERLEEMSEEPRSKPPIPLGSGE